MNCGCFPQNMMLKIKAKKVNLHQTRESCFSQCDISFPIFFFLNELQVEFKGRLHLECCSDSWPWITPSAHRIFKDHPDWPSSSYLYMLVRPFPLYCLVWPDVKLWQESWGSILFPLQTGGGHCALGNLQHTGNFLRSLWWKQFFVWGLGAVL